MLKSSRGAVRLAMIALAAAVGLTLLLTNATTTAINEITGMPNDEELIAKAHTDGTVRIIATLDMPFQPEDILPTPEAVQAQRDTIAALQEAVLERLAPYRVASVRRFRYVPSLAMEVDAVALKALIAALEVAGVTEDIPLPPLGPAH